MSSRSRTSLRDRIGTRLVVTDDIVGELEWAGENDVHFVDFCLDEYGLNPDSYTEEAISQIRTVTERYDITFGLHSESAVNVAATEPIVGDAVTEYLRAYVQLAVRLEADYVIFHAGYHFSSDEHERRTASIKRLRRVGEYAYEREIPAVICNMNPEPENSEIHMLCSHLKDCQYYADNLPPDHIGWAFNAPHAHLTPDGIAGFIDGIDVDRIRHVRLNDNRGFREEHLQIGEGNIDFTSTINQLEDRGFDGHYVLAFGSGEDMLRGRELLLDLV